MVTMVVFSCGMLSLSTASGHIVSVSVCTPNMDLISLSKQARSMHLEL